MTILITDIERSVRRWEAYPERMGDALACHERLLRAEIGRRGGYVFKNAGDGLYAAFHLPSDAVDSAVAGQRALAGADFSDVEGLLVRMAIYAGYADSVDGDYFGAAVNRCSRLLCLASAGQLVVGAAAAELARGFVAPEIDLLPLGLYRLKDVPSPEAVYQVTAPGLTARFPPLGSGCQTAHNLQPQLTTFVERPACAEAIRERLARHRLVTLVGSGGIGKTRMAVEMAYGFLEAGPDGQPLDELWSVELASFSDPVLVAEALCGAIGIDVPAQASATGAAIAYLRHKRALILLDNCEHVVEACSDLVARLMRQCPAVSVLATSRERLAVPGECPYTIPRLSLPLETGAIGLDEALAHEAVRLFAERAALIEGFALTDANVDAICAICRQLDGMPMAIELVVPQLRMLRAEDLAAKLQTHLLGVRDGRTHVPRHRTLAALFDWSYRLLDEEERALFRCYGLFAGSWSLEAATEIAAGSGTGGDRIFENLTSLVDKSLVSVDTSGAEPRYEYLQPVRQYALMKLQAHSEQALYPQLAAYLVRRFRTAHSQWPRTASAAWLDAYRPEIENVRAALDWGFDGGGDLGLALELTGYATRLWDELSLLSERRRYGALAADRAPPDTPPEVLARLCMVQVSSSQHGDRTNFDRAIRAAALFAQAGRSFEEGEAIAKAGAALLTPETVALALPYFDRAVALLEPHGVTKPLAACLRSKSVANYLAGDFDAARLFVAQSEAVARTVGDDGGLVAVQIAAAELAFASQDPEAAIAVVETTLAGERCNRRQRVLGWGNLAAYRLSLDRIDEAAAAALESLRHAKALDWAAAITRAVEHLGLVLACRGDLQSAANLLGFGDAFYAGGTASREWTELATSDRLRRLLGEALSPAQLTEAMAVGAGWDHDRAAAAALRTSGHAR